MLEKVSIDQLENVLRERKVDMQFSHQHCRYIMLDCNYRFYYNFDASYFLDDKDFGFRIYGPDDELDALDENECYIEGEIDEEYLGRCVDEYVNDIVYEMNKYED